MARGDPNRVQNLIGYQGGMAQNQLGNLREELIPQNQNFWNLFLKSVGNDDVTRANVESRFNNFADTGGYSGQDLNNIRSRSLSPIRSIYSRANQEVDRGRALQGGYSPGFNVLKSRMAREQSSAISDQVGNTEAGIAQMVNEGKRFGTSGLLSTYGTTPGATSMAQSGVLGSNANRLALEELQQRLGLGLIGSQIDKGNMKGGASSIFKGFTDLAGVAGQNYRR